MIECERAPAAAWPAGLALVPQAAETGSELLIARRDGRLAGAAALLWRNVSQPPGFPLHVAVLPAQRRAGVGRALVAAAAALVRGEAAGLCSAPLDGESDALAFALACGFRPCGRTFLLSAPLEFAQVRLQAKTAAARAAGGIAARAQVRPLATAEIESAAVLVSAALGGGPLVTAGKIAGLMGADNPVRPHAATVDGQLAGVVLCHGAGRMLTVEAMVVPPAWRQGHLSQIMMLHIIELAMAAGLETGQFQSEEQVVTTFDVLDRAAGLAVPVRLRCHLPVPAGDPAA